jgi:hypothetical protein
MDFTGLALQQQLGDGGGGAEVALDLEWRVGIKEVGVAECGRLISFKE